MFTIEFGRLFMVSYFRDLLLHNKEITTVIITTEP